MKRIFTPPFFVLISLILIVLFYFVLPGYNWIPFPFNILGILISLSGFAIMGKSRDLFRKYQTTLAIEKSTFLLKEGIFSRTRNPMYMGMFLLLLGIGICFRNMISVFISLVFFLLMNFIFVPKEEKLMYDSFGQEYLDYKKKVKRWI
ncbi:MAG: isoprenylcysteine carboxylmethyltransferase family protein [Ignavibacteria bacterium]|jgi:protein-S-isoprenylcysteine O-methyltransferase Ste14